MKIYIIRHGYPDYELDTLTPLGLEQAFKLGEKYKNIPMDVFYISTHGRACKTAEPLLKYHPNAKVNYVDWAREDLGAKYYSTKDGDNFKWYFWIPRWTTLFRSQELSAYGNEWINHPEVAKTTMPEGFKIMAESVDNFMLDLGYKHDRKAHTYEKIKDVEFENVVVVAHGAFAFSFISNLLDIPYPEFTTTHQCMDCTGVTVLEILDGMPCPLIVKYNDTSHLDTEIKFTDVGV